MGHPDRDEMMALATRLAKVIPEARRELQFFLKGRATVADTLPVWKRILRGVLYGGDIRVDRALRRDLLEWVGGHPGGLQIKRSVESPNTVAVSARVSTELAEMIDMAAKVRGVSRAMWIKMAYRQQAEHDLADDDLTRNGRPGWRAVADAMAARLRYHAGCKVHPTIKEANPDDCAFCKDREAYLLWVAKKEEK